MIFSSLSAEQQYFAGLIRSFVASAKEPVVAPDNLNWKVFQQIVYRDPRCLQPLGPLIYQSNAPWDLKTEVASGAKPLLDQTMQNLDALPEILKAFDSAKIPTIVLKGAAIAMTAYPSPHSRYMSDIDLLCPLRCLEAAGRVLKELGYVAITGGRSEVFYEEHHFHRIYKSRDGVHVELHWDLTVPSDFVRFDLDALFKNVVTVTTGDATFSAFTSADSLLHIVSQSVPDFNSVGRLLDLCMLIKAGALNDPKLVENAKRYKLATPLWVMLGLVSHVMESPEIHKTRESVRPNALKRICLDSLPRQEIMLDSKITATGVSRLLHLFCCPSWTYFFKTITRYIVPSEEDLHIQMYTDGQISPIELIVYSAYGTLSVLKMAAFLVWRLISFPIRRL